MVLDNKIVIYQTADGQTTVDVRMEGDTVWLSQAQMAELFQTDRTSILRHIKNIYKTGELEEDSTCAFFAQVRTEGKRTVTRQIPYYNLDLIISVGYRVNSLRGTQFRIWANRVLKEYLLKGYAVNKALTEQRYTELKQLVAVLGRTVKVHETLTSDDALNLIEVVSDYAYALDTLDKYDYQQLAVEQTTNEAKFHATYEGAMQAIEELKTKFGGSQWFAHEKDDSFKSSIGQIYQTFGGEDLYPSVEEKAAMLLYLVTKNHSFSDGNKRIAATLFLWFMAGNGILYNPDGTKRIADNTLVALTLMIAESRTEEKDVMVKVVVNLINKNNYSHY
jgi:prophage maintenance system killer protein